MISLFLIGNLDVNSISFLLKKSLFALIVNDKMSTTDITNRNRDINDCSAYSYISIFFNMLISINRSIATNTRANNNLIPSDIIFFFKDPPLKNNLKSFKSKVFNLRHIS